MDRLILAGGRRLQGEVAISGAKNATLPILAATLLSEAPFHLTNVPDLADVATICRLLTSLGVTVRRGRSQSGAPGTGTPDTPGTPGTVDVQAAHLTGCEAPYDLVKTMRASILALGPLVARLGEARVSLPGGCAIGARPVNLHLMGLQRMGAEVAIEHGYILVKAPRLRGAVVTFDLPTVTGTETLMMAATLAVGTTVIEQAAKEPEVVDLANFLNMAGARIAGAGTDTITIEGVERLHGATYRIIPDRIEAGTYLIAAAATGGEVFLRHARPDHLETALQSLQAAGVNLKAEEAGIRVRGPARVRAVDIRTAPYPGFPTDMQAQMMALLARADGTSVITETIFENRFLHVAELRRMGADITVRGTTAIVKGVRQLTGAPVMASDLRASASLVVAGLAAVGQTEVSRVYHLDRGYEQMDRKLSGLGAEVRRIGRIGSAGQVEQIERSPRC